MAARQALPSTLLRLCVICATSLQAMSPGTAPDHVMDTEVAQQDGEALAAQIYHDLMALIHQVRKEVTALSLAMRPTAEAPPEAGPLEGLDDASVQSATQLLQSLASDVVPKLAFLANLATKHQTVYRLTDAASQDSTLQMAKDLGAQVLLGEQARGPHVVSASVGTRFARAVHQLAVALVEHVAELCQSFMDERTRTALLMAQKKRQGAHAQPVAMPPCTRATSLSLTKKLWTLCDAAQGEKTQMPSYIARLPHNNWEAMCMVWRQNELLMRDGLAELQEALEHESDEETIQAEDSNVILEPSWDQSPVLSAEEKETGRHVHALLTQGLAVLPALGKALDKRTYDCDAGADAVEAMTAAQDDLIAAVLYEADESTPLATAVQEYRAACQRVSDTVPGVGAGVLDGLEEALHAFHL
ncbi:kynureninase [Malassezia nana]|uniref:Kynureninase n=1 Tax=Malassezia nana TaxID=180528 RepID=A0AAF0EGH5_9BASI|nr:kynureninase [Malassezia nana]